MEWYIVQVFSGYENSVKRAVEERIAGLPLESLIGEILVPSEQVSERRGKKQIKTTKKHFPGYVFGNMELTEESWSLINNTPKVTGFLGGKVPRPVPKSQMAQALRKSKGEVDPEDEQAEQAPAVVASYKVGDQVRVKSGPFANFTGEVEDVDHDKSKVKMSVSIFGRPTPVQVDCSEVEPVA